MDELSNLEYLIGNESIMKSMADIPSGIPFSEEIMQFCQDVSKSLMSSPLGKDYPDIVTLGFWLRKSAVNSLKERFEIHDGNLRFGRGIVFHIAPSNVPVNFAYSLFAGLLCGNANIVRIPTKDFHQVSVIVSVIKKVLKKHTDISRKICLVRYGHNAEINEFLSSYCDVRVVWGGNNTIAELRKHALPARATEITFADRFSLTAIDTDYYSTLSENVKERLARGFYNDTYLTDQNACTSPKLVTWMCSSVQNRVNVSEARQEFWSRLWRIVKKEYQFQDIKGVDKLTRKYLLTAKEIINIKRGIKIVDSDNRLVCFEIDKIIEQIREYFDNSGYFIEYITADILDLMPLCNNTSCQTIGYIGKSEMLIPLVNKGIKGIDRIVPVGKTMDFDFLWDGYNLYERLTRVIHIM